MDQLRGAKFAIRCPVRVRLLCGQGGALELPPLRRTAGERRFHKTCHPDRSRWCAKQSIRAVEGPVLAFGWRSASALHKRPKEKSALAAEVRFVSGHGFSRAVSCAKKAPLSAEA